MFKRKTNSMVISNKGVTFEQVDEPQGNIWLYKGYPYYVM